MQNNFQELTDEVIKEVRKLEVVMPETYEDIFYIKANELDISVSAKEKEKAIIYAMEKVQKLRKETEKSAGQLKINIKNARVAINQKNGIALKNIEIEVEALEKTIAELQENLYLDELTCIHNRRWLYEKFLQDDKFQQDGSIAFITLFQENPEL